MATRKAKNAKTGQPQEHLTADQISRKIEIDRKKRLITEQFYPALIKASKSVDEAKMLSHTISTLMMEDVLHTMRERKFASLLDKLVKQLTPNGERENEIRVLLETLIEEDLFTAREITEGMVRAIDQMIFDEMRDRGLDTMKVDWPKYLN